MDRKKQQVPPLRFAPVPRHAGAGGMTISFELDDVGPKINKVTASRDDKFKGGGLPRHGWRWMDRTHHRSNQPDFARRRDG